MTWSVIKMMKSFVGALATLLSVAVAASPAINQYATIPLDVYPDVKQSVVGFGPSVLR